MRRTSALSDTVSAIPSDTYIEVYHHQIRPNNKLKHLGFIWNKVRNKGTLSGANIDERINKFWQ